MRLVQPSFQGKSSFPIMRTAIHRAASWRVGSAPLADPTKRVISDRRFRRFSRAVQVFLDLVGTLGPRFTTYALASLELSTREEKLVQHAQASLSPADSGSFLCLCCPLSPVVFIAVVENVTALAYRQSGHFDTGRRVIITQTGYLFSRCRCCCISCAAGDLFATLLTRPFTTFLKIEFSTWKNDSLAIRRASEGHVSCRIAA